MVVYCCVQVVKKYNVVWQLLLRLKRAEMSLHGAWQTLKRKDCPRKRDDAQMATWQQHHMLSYILNCLLKYFQVRHMS